MEKTTPILFIVALLTHISVYSQNDTITQCISVNPLLIDACDGTKTIAKAATTFTFGIDRGFKNWNTDKPGLATIPTNVVVHKLIHDANFSQIFQSFKTDLNALCLSQHQIILFCNNHRPWLEEGRYFYATFFLFKVNSQFFIARVLSTNSGLWVDPYMLQDICIWHAGYEHRIVIPY